MSEFRMPALGADMQSGTLVDWRIKPGDHVKHGDIVAEVETEKGVIEVEIFETGVVDSLVVQPGQKVPVGATLAIVRTNGKEIAAEVPPSGAVPAEPRIEIATEEEMPAAEVPVTAVGSETRRPRISPRARKRAEELGVDIRTLAGTGEQGTITAADVEHEAAKRIVIESKEAVSPKAMDYTGMRRVIAAAMARSKREIPHYYLSTTIDMGRALDWLNAENHKRPVTRRLLYSVLLLRAVGLAIREIPEMNGFWVNDAFKPGDGVHVGVAIALRQGGLVNPAIHDVDKKNLDELMASMLDLVNRARTGHLRSSELSDGTITLTNLGEQGVESVFGVIYPPQVALIGFGRVVERPFAINGMIGIRPSIDTTLAADHRVSDGHRGGRFLNAIDRLLQEPEKL